MDIKLSHYDTAMLFGALLLARKHGDQQTYDWAAVLRDRLSAELIAADETQAILNDQIAVQAISEAEAENGTT